MVSLHGFSILILLTQSNHKSALLFSCTGPFSGACGYYTTFFLKSQTYVRIFLRKIKKFFRRYPQYRRERGGITTKTSRSFTTKARPPRKGDPQAGQRGRLFAAGISVAACFFVPPVRAVAFRLISGVSLSAAARSPAALVYDKTRLTATY